MAQNNATAKWPALAYEEWRETAQTLHLWLQIVGKIRLMRCPWVNHSWHVTLHATARGLGTPLMWHESGSFQIELDFIDHQLSIRADDGRSAMLPLKPQTTATFYRKVMGELDKLGLSVQINTMPNELPDPIRFNEDEVHRSYDPEYANRYWRILVQTERVFERFRARFIGKSSPVHYFWGSADLAVTRFSGREAPLHPGGVPYLPDWVTREAYSHEVSSAGFWAGGEQYPRAIFYSYAYPEPPGFSDQSVSPSAARYDNALKEFVLPYEEMRTAASPDSALLDFLQSTYEAASNLASWDRAALDRKSELAPRASGLQT